MPDTTLDPYRAALAITAAWLQCHERLLGQVNLPLSGDVTQWIRTYAEAVAQVGLLNVHLTGTSDPHTERRIGAQVSYGRQLGKIMDVLVPLAAQQQAALFADGEAQRRYEGFRRVVDEIEALKRRSADALIQDVRRWQDSPTRGEDVAALRAALDALDARDATR